MSDTSLQPPPSLYSQLFAVLKRFLSTQDMDQVLLRATRDERESGRLDLTPPALRFGFISIHAKKV
ncbi:hypothetical protein QC823_15520 [Halomonas vilamensis]|uniref:Uncharacterized protein n=1 Tax=Vreelandella vilamensis TaxID=531309 RepID=A0ABU1H7V4_9GAMM|nr:hypothetical protein [Halomonas vilamensis]MDR5900374.1 hypothetical protein [Halomonas vilamensis]